MKKQALLVVAGSMLAFASCQQEAGMDSAAMQATIDSTVNSRVEEIRLQMMASNDSMINELAQWKADSMIAAMKGGSTAKVTKPKPTTKPGKPAIVPPKEEAKPNGSSTSTRPGATNQNGTKVNDRPGATNSNTPKPTSDRPGAK